MIGKMVEDWRNRQGMACARNTCMSPDTRIGLRDDGSQTKPGVKRKVQSVTAAFLIAAGMNVVRIPSLWQHDSYKQAAARVVKHGIEALKLLRRAAFVALRTGLPRTLG